MNSVYHLLAPTYEEFKKKLDESMDEGLCCATIVWRPSGLTDYYKNHGWEGQPLAKVFKCLGVQRASELFYELTKNGKTSEKDAWLDVYSKEVALSERRAIYG